MSSGFPTDGSIIPASAIPHCGYGQTKQLATCHGYIDTDIGKFSLVSEKKETGGGGIDGGGERDRERQKSREREKRGSGNGLLHLFCGIEFLQVTENDEALL